MLKIPYVSAPRNACALACYTMVAQYYFPDVTFEEIAEISDWEEGYVVWGFKFWNWITEQGVRVTDYDLIDAEAWSNEGTAGLKRSLSEKEFTYIQTHTRDLETLSKEVASVLDNPLFIYHRQKPTMELLNQAITNGNPAEVVLDSHTLDRIDGFALHRVVVTDIDDETVTFHDPRENPRPHRRESLAHFEKSWLKAVAEPELCVYEKVER